MGLMSRAVSSRHESQGLPTLLDRRALKHVDLFMLILIDAVSDTLIPEIASTFGNEAAYKFLDQFAGLTIKVPTRHVLERAVRDTKLYHELSRIDRTDPSAVNRVAESYGLKGPGAMETFRRLHASIEKVARMHRRKT